MTETLTRLGVVTVLYGTISGPSKHMPRHGMTVHPTNLLLPKPASLADVFKCCFLPNRKGYEMLLECGKQWPTKSGSRLSCGAIYQRIIENPAEKRGRVTLPCALA